jgi:hypothetical protein
MGCNVHGWNMNHGFIMVYHCYDIYIYMYMCVCYSYYIYIILSYEDQMSYDVTWCYMHTYVCLFMRSPKAAPPYVFAEFNSAHDSAAMGCSSLMRYQHLRIPCLASRVSMCQSSADQEVKETDEKPVITARGVCSHWRSMIPVDSWFGRLAPLWSWWLAGRLDTLLVKPADSREHPRTTRQRSLTSESGKQQASVFQECASLKHLAYSLPISKSPLFATNNVMLTLIDWVELGTKKCNHFLVLTEDITGSVIPWALILTNSPSRVSSEIASLVPALPVVPPGAHEHPMSSKEPEWDGSQSRNICWAQLHKGFFVSLICWWRPELKELSEVHG